MTLCLAWLTKHEVYLASDSRLTNSYGGIVTDDATKIFRINVEVYGSTPSETPNEEPPLLHQTTYGLCFAGSYIGGSTIASTIEEVLSNIQAAPMSDISIENLSDIALAVYKQISRQLTSIHGEGGISELLLAGHCLLTNEFKLYKFSPTIKDQMVDYEKKEIKLIELPVFLGDNSAKVKANSLLSNLSNEYTYLHLLRDVIRDEEVRTVGGNIQIGQFKAERFKTLGIVEYSLLEAEDGYLEVKDEFKFKGFSLNLDDSELRRGDINILKPLCNPFENERNAYYEQVMNRISEKENEIIKRSREE